MGRGRGGWEATGSGALRTGGGSGSSNTETGPSATGAGFGAAAGVSICRPSSSAVTSGAGASSAPIRAAPEASALPSALPPRENASPYGTRLTSVIPALLAAATTRSRPTAPRSSGMTIASRSGDRPAVVATLDRSTRSVMTAARAPVRPLTARSSGSVTIGPWAESAASPTSTLPSGPAATALAVVARDAPRESTRGSCAAFDVATAAEMPSASR